MIQLLFIFFSDDSITKLIIIIICGWLCDLEDPVNPIVEP